ncbi:hypothetical protein CEXT_434461, partial [Caerostris extrusa]
NLCSYLPEALLTRGAPLLVSAFWSYQICSHLTAWEEEVSLQHPGPDGMFYCLARYRY